MFYEVGIALVSLLGISSIIILGNSSVKRHVTNLAANIKILCKSKYEKAYGIDKAYVSKLDGSRFEIRYTVAGQRFRMLAEPKSGPLPFFEINDQDGRDITDIIVPYIGPSLDWHGNELTPNYFGLKSIVFLCATADYKFEEHDTLPPIKKFTQ